MPSSIYITDADGTNYYLSGTGTSYTGSGTPWTAQTTSPYQLSMNDQTGPIWTPQAPPRSEIYSGGPPFRLGSDLAYRSFGNVEESLGVQMYASSHDNAVTLLRTLRRVLSSTLTARPAILVVQPDGATSASYFEIYGATVQEDWHFIGDEAGLPGTKILRAIVTWTRTPFGGRLSSGETLINAVSFGNTGTGSPDNIETLGTSGSGDYIREGGPLNVRMPRTSITYDINDVFMATISGRTYTANTTAWNTTSTTGATVVTLTFTGGGADFLTNHNLAGRFVLRATGVSTNSQLQIVALTGAGEEFYRSPWITGTTVASANILLEFGRVSPSFLYRIKGTGSPDIGVNILARSTNGAAATGSLAYVEWVRYYTWCRVYTEFGGALNVESFVERSGLPVLPRPTVAYNDAVLSSGTHGLTVPIYGRAPVYVSGASLYLAWRENGANRHVTTDTSSVTVTHAPLYHTLRGNG